jgi:SAM-dependent methyltransferase
MKNDPQDLYCQEYFMDGIRSGLSNYEDYSWKPELTIPMAQRFVAHLGVSKEDTVLDFGCSRGYFVKALCQLGLNAFGKDLSKWAIENGDPEIKERLTNELEIPPHSFDWINAKDVLEHMRLDFLTETLRQFSSGARKGIFIIVPLTNDFNGSYLRPEDEADVTHEIRWPFEFWLKLLHDYAPCFTVHGSYYIPNLKEASLKSRYSCGFFTLLRYK